MIQRHPEPFLWLLFSAGGVLSAMLMPILLFLFGVAFPLGWLAAPGYAQVLAVLTHPAMLTELTAEVQQAEARLSLTLAA